MSKPEKAGKASSPRGAAAPSGPAPGKEAATPGGPRQPGAPQPAAQPAPAQPTAQRHPSQQAAAAQPGAKGGSAHRARGLRALLTMLGEWRNWRLPVKVATVLAVPALAAISLGAVQIQRDVTRAEDFTTVQKLIDFRGALVPLVTGLQDERWLSAKKLGTTLPVDGDELGRIQAQVDKDAATILNLGPQLLDPNSAAGIRYQELAGQLASLGSLHKLGLSTTEADVVTVVSTYGQLIGFAVDLEQALSTEFGDVSLTGTATALDDVEVANEQVRQQEAVVTVALFRGRLLDTELAAVQTADVLLTERRKGYQVVATSDQLVLFQGTDVVNALNAREQLTQSVLSNGRAMAVIGSSAKSTSAEPLGVGASDWIGTSDAATTQLVTVRDKLYGELRAVSAGLRDDASQAAVIEAIVLSVILLLAVGIGVIVGRHLLRSLKILRGTALEVAERQLPGMVASLDRGELTGLDIAPVAVHTHEELGQLARAFDAVHGQAVRSAVGQATLRSNMRNTFVNLSRRSQGLVERQLRLMEQLERNEEDPQQLANLFKLDHLATRMRRNNENLMVLSGDDPARRSGQPLPLADVLRAAVSEIEQYQRVVVRSTPTVDVLGYASGDLVRLIAELLDNATSFSPPETNVRVGGAAAADGSIRIEIRDEGIGMAGAELAEANRRLASSDVADVPVSRQMGLYVIGRLAQRHGITVTLEAVPDSGLLGVVLVPGDLVRQGTGPAESPVPMTAPAAQNGHADRVNGYAGTPNGTNGSHGPGGNGHGTNGNGAMFEPQPPAPAPAGEPFEWAHFTGPAIRPIEPSAPGSGLIAGEIAPESWIPASHTGFTWFVAPEPEPEPTPAPAPIPPTEFTAVGLPRRVPRAHAVPNLVEPPKRPAPNARPAPNTPPPSTPAPAAGPKRNPGRTRGFLNDYQSGIRQGGSHARSEPAWDYESGERHQ